jgi:hypothetical protein
VEDVGERTAEAERLEVEMAEVCGILHASTAWLVRLIGRVLETEAWHGFGIRTAEQWVAWRCGVSPRRARVLVTMARRLGDLPETRAAFESGELGEDSVGLICGLAPTEVDADVAELAKNTTVTQLRRVLTEYRQTDETEDELQAEAQRSVSFGSTDTGTWRLSAELPADEGAVWEKALTEARDELFKAGEAGPGPGPSPADVSWADAFVAVAERSLAAVAVAHPHRDRTMVLLHVGTTGGHLHLGPGVSEGLRRYIGCDSRVRPVFEEAGRAVSVGRAFRTVPDRTRVVIEDRDRGCRVPGCDRSRWLHVHHIQHWEDGGATDTPNLLCLCQHHHRLHHQGKLGIEGNGDDPKGVVFTDERGRVLESCGKPAPFGARPAPAGNWTAPAGEPLDPWAIYFNEPAPAP